MNQDCEYIQHRLSSIMSKSEMARISMKSSDMFCITVDVHGMKCCQAKRFINNIINIVRIIFHLIIIHGYNHGTAIKDMLSYKFSNIHITNQYVDPYNQGMTHILIAA